MKLFARKVNNYSLYASHAWYVPGVKGMFGLLGWFLLGNLLGGVVQMIFSSFLPVNLVQQYSMLVVYPLSFVPAMIYAAQQSQRNSLFETGYKLSSNNFGRFKGWQVALITVALTAATMTVADLPNYWNYKLTTLLPGMKSFYDLLTEVMRQMTTGPLWSSFLLVAIFAPIFEEWLCRGMVLRGLLTHLKPGWAIVVSALFFAIIHMNPWQALNAFIIGVIMGYVYYKTGNLWLTMLMHFVNNGTAVILSQFPSLQEIDFWIDVLPKNVYSAIYVGGLLLLCVCLWAFRSIPLAQKRGNIDIVEL